VRRVLELVIGWQLISDCISGMRRTVVLCKSPKVISWLKDTVAHATNINLSQCTDKNMIPTCAQSSVACDWLTINFWLYFRYSTYCGAMQISSSYFWLKDAVTHETNIGLSQCTNKNMISTCAQSSVFGDWLSINFWLYFSYTMFRGARQCLSNFFRHSSMG